MTKVVIAERELSGVNGPTQSFIICKLGDSTKYAHAVSE